MIFSSIHFFYNRQPLGCGPWCLQTVSERRTIRGLKPRGYQMKIRVFTDEV
jgi:hypothetical protein